MEDLMKKRAHWMPSNYVTLQQLQEQRLREQKKQREEEEEKQRQLEKQKEEEEEKGRERRRIKAARGTVREKSIRMIETLSIEGEIDSQEGEVEKSNKEKNRRRRNKGKRTVDVDKSKREGGSEITQQLEDMKVSDHGEMDRVDGFGEKSTADERRFSGRAKTLPCVMTVNGEKTGKMYGSDGKNGDFRNEKKGRYGRSKEAGRKWEVPRQITAVDCEKREGLDVADAADGENGGRRTEPVRPTVQFGCDQQGKMDGSDGAKERSLAETELAPSMKPLVAAAVMPRKVHRPDGVYDGSTVKIRSYRRRGGKSTAGMRGDDHGRRVGGRSTTSGLVWVRKEEIPEAAPASFG